MPGTRCTVSVCNNSIQKTRKDPSLQHVKYHSFPREKALRRQWALLCRRKGAWRPEGCHVCSEHFRPDDYVRDLQSELLGLPPRRALVKTAVPSVGLGRGDPPGRPAGAEGRSGRRERRANRKIVDRLLLKRYDQDSDPLRAAPTQGRVPDEIPVDTVEEQREDPAEEFIVEYLDEPKTCDQCGSFDDMKNEHDLLRHQYDALAVENRELSSKLEHSRETVELHRSKLKEVLKELAALKDNRAKEHMIVQSRCDNGMYEVFVVMNSEGNK